MKKKTKKTLIYRETARILKSSTIQIFGHTAQYYQFDRNKFSLHYMDLATTTRDLHLRLR